MINQHANNTRIINYIKIYNSVVMWFRKRRPIDGSGFRFSKLADVSTSTSRACVGARAVAEKLIANLTVVGYLFSLKSSKNTREYARFSSENDRFAPPRPLSKARHFLFGLNRATDARGFRWTFHAKFAFYSITS